ncbi:MAG: Fis family transcriptional regulator [Limnothrix sp. RL_2_0]|nr:Fis family transcriptional regulator [Limnothrix sp. RL_2_0]
MTNNSFQNNPNSNANESSDHLEQLELLSAYFDGEATPEECQQVQQLLDENLEFKQQYLHFHQIRQGLQAMPIPTGPSTQHLSNQVFRRLHWSRGKVVSLWGGGAIAALFMAGIVSNIPKANQSEMAKNSPRIEAPTATDNTQPPEEALIVALNRPVLQIPKLATATETENP